MNVASISRPLPGEHLAATSPAMRPETDAGFRLRLNFWPGRSLTAEALELEQEHRAGHLAWQGRVPTPGIVAGLDAGLEEPAVFPAGPLAAAGHFLHLAPGHGISAYGEDVQVPRPLRIPLEGIAVHAVRVIPAEGASEAPAAGATSSTPLEFGGVKVETDTFAADYVPWAAVLVARPAELGVFGKSDPEDPCELDPSRDAFADQRRLDALVLRLIQLPSAWESDPLLADRADPRWRNRLAHYIFARERENAARQSVRFLAGQPAGERWEVVHAGAALFPWELFGVPIALFGAETTAAGEVRFFLDCGAVARPGGLPRARTRPAARLSGGAGRNPLDTPGAGGPTLWRAQVDQFAQHLGSLRDNALAEQAARFQFVPPAGLLPRDALDLLTTEEAGTLSAPDRAAGSRFFPEGFAVEAVPIPTEDLDAALAASAPLLPYDFLAPGSDLVRVLVPVAQNLFDPRLLVIETEDPFFATELGRLVWVRQDWRQRRDAIRAQRDRLLDLIDGPRPAGPLPALEAGQIEPEPVEAFSVTSPVRALYLSPADTPGPWELDADVHAFFTRGDRCPHHGLRAAADRPR